MREGRQRGGKERELQHGGGEVREGERGLKVEREREGLMRGGLNEKEFG